MRIFQLEQMLVYKAVMRIAFNAYRDVLRVQVRSQPTIINH